MRPHLIALLYLLMTIPMLAVFGQDRRGSTASSTAGKIEQLYRAARIAEAAKDYAGAIEKYEHILRLSPALHTIRANLGLMQYLNGDLTRAEAEFRRALAGDTTLQTAHLFLGMSLLDTGRPVEAIDPLMNAVRRKPEDAGARYQLARAYYIAERYSEALRELQMLEAKQPGSADTLYLLGRVHLRMSLAAYDQLREKHPEDYRIYQLLGENYALQSQYGPAIVNYRKAIERNPRAPGIHLKLGEAQEAAGEMEMALESYTEESRLNPRDGYAHERAGLLLIKLNRTVEALAQLEKAIQLDPRSAGALVALGRLRLDAEKLQEAIPLLRQAVSADPRSSAAWFQLARALQQAGDRAGAREALAMYEKFRQ
jgi:protein O-GlcNAc transferase